MFEKEKGAVVSAMSEIKVTLEQLTRKVVTFILITLILMTIPTELTAGSIVVQEETITWGENMLFETPMIFDNGIVSINFTNLPTSDSSVRMTRDPNGDDFFTYSPYIPQNFTLEPGESLVDTFTLLESSGESGGLVVFGCSVITEDSSATIKLETLVIKEGRRAPGFLVIGSLLAITLIATLNKIASKKIGK